MKSGDMSGVQQETVEITGSLFGVMGENGNCVNIYDTDSVVLRYTIQAGHIIKSFQFTKDSREIIIVTKD